MLSATLRPDGAPFPIAAEYPIVLGTDGSQFSFCIGDPDAPAAHANLWPREFIDQSHNTVLRVGLVGNVASAEGHRGKGYVRALISKLQNIAQSQGMDALILWSDLVEFYQKFGFQSCGRELRWHFTRDRLSRISDRSHTFVSALTPSQSDLKSMLRSRFPVPLTLRRTTDEFRQLLKIPHLSLLVSQGSTTSYVIIGKGCDMTCVVHEWGAPDAQTLTNGVLAAAEAHGLDDVIVLTPPALPRSWLDHLGRAAIAVSEHQMALGWWPEQSTRSDQLTASFIWGLDSI
ncbi:MAG: GNAT family N-acetyltransferase [Deltaproteobacteria bacterium]|nr:GNAT family N-acetyltransferase [Deltaproteobacteria bacterium]